MTMRKKVLAWGLALLCMLLAVSCGDDTKPHDGLEPYSFVVDGVVFTPGADASSVFAVWKGKTPQISVKASCLGGVDGEDVTYVYDDFRIQTFRSSEGEELRWVILMSDAMATTKGIAVGSAVDQVKATYGEPVEESDSLLVYLQGGTKLRFKHREGAVTSIEYTVAE